MGKGSTFTLFLPARFPETPTPRQDEAEQTELGRELTEIAARSGVPPSGRSAAASCRARSRTTATRSSRATGSSRGRGGRGAREDLLGKARERGFKGIVAQRGDAGLALVHEFKPDAIILDLKLPVMDGWTVLDRLKHDPATRHIPVHIISADGDERGRAARRRRRAGREASSTRSRSTDAFDDLEQFLARGRQEPPDRGGRRGAAPGAWWSSSGTATTSRSPRSGPSEEALDALAEKRFDCVVLDLKLPDEHRLRADRGDQGGTASSATCR